MGSVMTKIRDLFFSSKMEIVLVGLENSGKTTFVNYLNVGRHLEEAPTVGLNVKVMKKGGVTLKVWDIGGQKQYRSEWARYTRGQIIHYTSLFSIAYNQGSILDC